MKNVIILKRDGLEEAWGGLTNICREHKEIKYHSIKGRQFPFKYKGYEFSKVPYNKKTICLT